MDYTSYPPQVVEDLARLRRRIAESNLPDKVTDQNLIIGTWNIRSFGSVYPSFDENPGSPKRNLRSLAYIAEIITRMDIVAIQEIKRDTSGIRRLQEWLGSDWGLIITDVTAGAAGNAERLGFLFDRRRVQPSGLAGEIVIPPKEGTQDPPVQFARTPYAVGFSAGSEAFVLVTAHILYGEHPEDREPEIRSFANYLAHEMRDRAEDAQSEEENLLVLGDFNIDRRVDDPRFQAFTATGLNVPSQLRHLRTTFGTIPKFYDQIAWFMEAFDLIYEENAGAIDITHCLYPELTTRQMSYRVSDHFPLWAEFRMDRSEQIMAHTLGLDPHMPDPLSNVPDLE